MKMQKVDAAAPLSWEEWDFPRNKLPDWQVRFCVNYEYARESKEFRQKVDEIRARKPQPPGSPFNVACMEFSGPQCWVLNTVLARRVPEFPAAPWLELSEERRTQLLMEIGITEDTGGYAYGFIDRGHPDAYFEALGKDTVGCIDEAASFVLEIDFKEQDAFISKGFLAWLKATRAALLALDNSKDSPYRATRTRKGKSQNISVYRLALKDLSLYRRQGAGLSPSESDTQDPKVAESMIKRAEMMIKHFSDWGSARELGFVESLLEAAPGSRRKKSRKQ